MFPDIAQLTNKITQFTHSYSQTQQEIITLLKTQNLLLAQILDQIKYETRRIRIHQIL